MSKRQKESGPDAGEKEAEEGRKKGKQMRKERNDEVDLWAHQCS